MMKLLRSTWMRLLMRRVHYRDCQSRFDVLYRVENPWDMSDAGEQFRFKETNRLIEENFGSKVGSVLEIGCGEAHQSLELLRICESLHGLDVSSRAVERAKQRCPQATFEVGDIFQMQMPSTPTYDLVVACEVLFYMSDVAEAAKRMSRLGRACLITYYEAQAERIESALSSLTPNGTARFSHGDKSWRAMWWRSKHD